MSNADQPATPGADAPEPEPPQETLGQAVQRLDDATVRATVAVHKALLGTGKVTYVGMVSPSQWNRLPVTVHVTPAKANWVIVPWSSAVVPSAADYVRLVRGAFKKMNPARLVLVTSEELPPPSVARLSAGGPPVAVVGAASLTATGPKGAVKPIADLLGGPGFARHQDLDIGAAIRQHNLNVRDVFRFREMLNAATPRAWFTPALLAVNVLVYAAMLAAGAHWLHPSIDDVMAWGAMHGPNVVHGGEAYRMLTANYVHIGLIHIACNLWCLWAAGRFAERLLGNGAFLLTYTLSGIGGSVASLYFNPLVVGAGASGAVFGIFGMFLGFMVMRPRTLPILIFKPVLKSALAFVFYNLVFGFTIPGIDNAAHVGGLVTGLMCGMALSRRLPVPKTGTPWRRYALTLIVVLVLAAAGNMAADRVPEDAPVWSAGAAQAAKDAAEAEKKAVEETSRVRVAYNHFIRPAGALLNASSQIDRGCRDVLLLFRARVTMPRAIKLAGELIGQARDIHTRLQAMICRHPELEPLKAALLDAFAERGRACDALDRFVRSTDPNAFEAYRRHRKSSNQAHDRFIDERNKLLKRHGLVLDR